MKTGKTIAAIILAVLAMAILAVSSFGANLTTLNRIVPANETEVRDFFSWKIEKYPVASVFDNRILTNYAEFRRIESDGSQGISLHVGGRNYSPFQPITAYDTTVTALDEMGLSYKPVNAGEWDGGQNIFAQFEVGAGSGETTGKVGWGYRGSSFNVGGKDYSGLITMGKGSDETLPLVVWLTIVCIVCQNTFRMALAARKEGKNAASLKQTKHSSARIDDLINRIVALFKVQETVAATLKRMSETPISLDQAERAFLGLLKRDEETPNELKDTGKTRLTNTRDVYMDAFKSEAAGTIGKTQEDWFQAVTYVGSHGVDRSEEKRDEGKIFLSSEFGTYSRRKSLAFDIASSPEAWDKAVQTGDEFAKLLQGTVKVSSAPSALSTEVNAAKQAGEDAFKALLSRGVQLSGKPSAIGQE